MHTPSPRHNHTGRVWLGIILFCLGFWAGVARMFGVFGNPLHMDGAALVVLIAMGLGIYLVVTGASRDLRNDRERYRS